jgi:hypothetical protein
MSEVSLSRVEICTRMSSSLALKGSYCPRRKEGHAQATQAERTTRASTSGHLHRPANQGSRVSYSKAFEAPYSSRKGVFSSK